MKEEEQNSNTNNYPLFVKIAIQQKYNDWDKVRNELRKQNVHTNMCVTSFMLSRLKEHLKIESSNNNTCSSSNNNNSDRQQQIDDSINNKDNCDDTATTTASLSSSSEEESSTAATTSCSSPLGSRLWIVHETRPSFTTNIYDSIDSFSFESSASDVDESSHLNENIHQTLSNSSLTDDDDDGNDDDSSFNKMYVDCNEEEDDDENQGEEARDDYNEIEDIREEEDEEETLLRVMQKQRPILLRRQTDESIGTQLSYIHLDDLLPDRPSSLYTTDNEDVDYDDDDDSFQGMYDNHIDEEIRIMKERKHSINNQKEEQKMKLLSLSPLAKTKNAVDRFFKSIEKNLTNEYENLQQQQQQQQQQQHQKQQQRDDHSFKRMEETNSNTNKNNNRSCSPIANNDNSQPNNGNNNNKRISIVRQESSNPLKAFNKHATNNIEKADKIFRKLSQQVKDNVLHEEQQQQQRRRKSRRSTIQMKRQQDGDSHNSKLIELVWYEHSSFGISIHRNDDSGYLKVLQFKPNSQAEQLCYEHNINPDIFINSTIISVNDKGECNTNNNNNNNNKYDRNDLFNELKDPSRPKTILFELDSSSSTTSEDGGSRESRDDDMNNNDGGVDDSTTTSHGSNSTKREDAPSVPVSLQEESKKGMALSSSVVSSHEEQAGHENNNSASSSQALASSSHQEESKDDVEVSSLVSSSMSLPTNKKKKQNSLVQLTWKEWRPLGISILRTYESNEDDEYDLPKVLDFPKGSQADDVCKIKNINPSLFVGSTIVGVDGVQYENGKDLYKALTDPSRPKSVLFELSSPNNNNNTTRAKAA